ncbi:MAG: sensor histidine kinase [Bacillota bacterium]
MKRTWLLWAMFGLCLAIGLGAMGWISLMIVRLDGAELEARRQAQLEENIRLALWRMDSAVAPLIAQETARPYFAYSAFTPAERAYTRMFNEIRFGDVLIPSPLLNQPLPQIHLHFQFLPDGTLTSPQVPTGNMRDLATRHTTPEQLEAAAVKLKQIKGFLSRDALLAALPVEPAEPSAPASAPAMALMRQKVMPERSRQMAKSIQEYQVRERSAMQANNYEMLANRASQDKPATPVGHIREGVMRPLWINGVLVLARRVSVNEADYVQGCWLDWPAICGSLLANVQDLLPAAKLEPAGADMERQPRRLATIPVRLIPGEVTFAPAAGASPIRMMLGVAWVCVIAASAAVGVLLWGALLLSQRRAAFVSAVTHELRTPLTTVSMYAEMLEGGMIPDEQKRRRYLSTLRIEADRLGHLVENVLAYSRIERGNPNGRIQEVTLSQLIDHMRDRLAARSEQAGMQLRVEMAEGMADLVVRADASAVEQILLNLVDNSGKYAAGNGDRRIHLQVDRQGAVAEIRLRDHGPGISASDLRRMFRPFSKSARDAANSAPGVGLGLALSRRLAREMHGDLELDGHTQDGACFVLTLPITP